MKQPIIGVHLLTEFTFCSRAGLCTREATTDDEPESPANLNFLPDLDEQEIRQAIHQRGIRGLGFAFASLVWADLVPRHLLLPQFDDSPLLRGELC